MYECIYTMSPYKYIYKLYCIKWFYGTTTPYICFITEDTGVWFGFGFFVGWNSFPSSESFFSLLDIIQPQEGPLLISFSYSCVKRKKKTKTHCTKAFKNLLDSSLYQKAVYVIEISHGHQSCVLNCSFSLLFTYSWFYDSWNEVQAILITNHKCSDCWENLCWFWRKTMCLPSSESVSNLRG